MVTLAKGFAAIPAESVAKVDEIQQLTIDATGGTFTLALGGFVTRRSPTTPLLRPSRPRSRRCSSVGVGNVQVRKAGSVYRVTFVGTLAGSDVALLSANGSGLTNGAGALDTLHIDDRATTADTWALLTSSSLTGLSLPAAERDPAGRDRRDRAGPSRSRTARQTTGALPWNAEAWQCAARPRGPHRDRRRQRRGRP